MKPIEIPLGIMAYQSRSTPWAAQRCINWYAETAPAVAKTKTQVVLLPRPGLEVFCEIDGPGRGTLVLGSTLYAVFGGTVYSIDENGVATSIGTISDNGSPVTMAATATQITIVSTPQAWVYTLLTADFTEIADVSFPGSKWVTQVDGYFVHAPPGSSGEFFISNLLDGTMFDALDFATAELDADELVAPISDHGELWLFGSRTIEPWGVTGASDFPIEPIASAKIQRGTAAGTSIARQDNTLFWIGDDLCVYRAAGYVPQRISTHAIEAALNESASTIGDVIGCAYTQDGHGFYQITLAGEWTFVYDAATGLWAERQSFGSAHWGVNYIVQAYGRVIGAGEGGNLYTLSLDAVDDDGDLIRYETTSPSVHADGSKVGMSRLQIDLKTGIGTATGQGSDPQLMASWSDDGGRAWSPEHWNSMGQIGDYLKRLSLRRLGQFYSRIFKFAVTDPVRPSLIGAYADIEILPP